MALQESGEMYLETILILGLQSGSVRAVDVAERMGVSKPSVSRAVGILKEGGYLSDGPGGGLALTPQGQALAEKVYERHQVLSQLLMQLGVDEAAAVQDACRMEHIISDATFQALKRLGSQGAPGGALPWPADRGDGEQGPRGLAHPDLPSGT